MEKWGSETVREGRNNNTTTTTIYNDHIVSLLIHYLGGCTDTILGIEILNRVENFTHSFSNGMLLAFCPITNNRATLLHVASQVHGGKVLPVSKVSQNYRSTRPFSVLETHARFSIYIESRERAINTRNLYVEYFYILISVAINDLSMLGNDSTNKEMSTMKKFINHRHVVVVFFFFFLQCQTVFSWNQAERYFMKNNRVKFTKRDAL